MVRAVQDKSDVIERIGSSGEQLHKYGIAHIGLFGSFRRDQGCADSDVDLLVGFEAGRKSFDNFIEACFYLEDVLGRRVELVTEESLSPYLKDQILQEVEYVPLES